MRIVRFFIPLVFLLHTASLSVGQTTTHWYDLVLQPNVNINEVKKAFEIEAAKLSKTDADAFYKHFNRWKTQVEPYADLEGNIMNADQRQAAFKRNVAFKKSIGGNWRELGPFTAKDVYRGVGRLNCIAFHPTDSNIMWAGAPYGGVWKTEDYGKTWACLTDHLPSFGVSAIAVDPNNADIIYLGTGDGETGRNPGFGVWKTTDGGQTWLQKNSTMGNVIVNDILVFEDNTEEIIAATSSGIYSSVNGGNTWGQVLQLSSTLVNGNTGVRQLRFKPDNADVIYAVSTKFFYTSDNRGRTWQRLTLRPIPEQKLSLTVSAAEPNSVWMFDHKYIYKSEDAGESAEVIYTEEGERDLGGQSWYNAACDVSPTNSKLFYQGHVPTYVTVDTITSWEVLRGIHSDVHYMRHSPVTTRLWAAGDGGIVSLNDDMKTFTDHTNMGVSEIYKMSQSPFFNDAILNGYQDCGSKYFVGNTWKDRVGADGMDCVFDPDSAEIYFTTIQYGDIRRHIGGPDGRVSNFPDPQGNTQNTRGPWVSPIWLDKKDPNILYTAQHSIYRYQNCREDRPKKDNWEKIDNGLPSSGEFREIEQNEAAPDIFYVTNGSFLYRTWNIHVENPLWESLADNYTRSAILLDVESSKTDSNLLYVSMNKRVIVSNNGGESFKELSNGLPELPIYSLQHDYITGHLYAGTDVGVYVLPKGDSVWLEFSEKLSASAPVYEIEIYYHPQNHDNSMLKAATFGRGQWESSLYGSQPEPTLPFYAFVKTDVSFLEEAEFMVDVSFRRGWAFHNVIEFVANDLKLSNAEVMTIKGQQNQWTVELKAINEGEIRVSIPQGVVESNETAGLLNEASEELVFNFVKTGTQFGYEGPAGVGSLEQVAVWLDANDLSENYNIANEISVWTDKLKPENSALRIDTFNGPQYWQEDSFFNGNAAVAFIEDQKTGLRIDSITTGENISAVTVAASFSYEFNEHAWLGSSRDPNGFILHNYEEHRYARMMIYDSTEQVFRSPYLQVQDTRDAHIYGMAYRNNVYIWNYTDWQEGFEPISTPKPRFSSEPINIQLGRDRDDRFGDGLMAEHIVYNEALMKSHRTILYNYLSQKYNTDLGNLDYFHLDENYASNIAGIGKESEVDYHADAKGLGHLRVNKPTELNDGEYLMWADNGKELNNWNAFALNANNELSFERSELDWKFEETGEVGKVNVSINANELSAEYRYFFSVNEQVLPLAENDGWLIAQASVESGTVLHLLRLPAETKFLNPVVYPNPINPLAQTLSFQLQVEKEETVILKLFNTKGQMLWQEERQMSLQSSIEQRIELSSLQLKNGNYYLNIELNGQLWVEKLMVQNN